MVVFMCCKCEKWYHKSWNPTYKCAELGFMLGPNNIEHANVFTLD